MTGSKAPLTPAEVTERLDAAGALYDAGQLDEAARAYETVEARNPGDFRAPYSLAVIDIARGPLANALERLKRVVRLQ
ncbi:MAG TPA: tetratricopeptide repeat protein, partial [Caulobacteraceae bacterium]|nr:tetratricopeptide repeat protein [Caulobacteraceae bacterium]